MANDDIKFVKENSLASKPLTEADLDKPFIVIGFMKNEKGSGGKQTKGNIQEIRKRGDVYDIYQGDELRPSSRDVPKEEILRLYSQEATSGYMYKTTSKQDPKLAKWINIDDEDIYINRLRDKDPLSPLKFIGESKKPVADLDPKTATLREVAEAYAEKSKRGKAFVTSSLQFFKDIADEPGSALRLFEKDAEGNTLLSKTFKGTEDTSTVKTAMQNLRQVGLTLKESIGPDTPEYKLLPDKAPNTDLNNRIFGRSEPAKALSEVAINPDKAKMSQLFAGVAKYLDNPNTKAIAQAIIFNLNTGLRPNAAAGLQVTAYNRVLTEQHPPAVKPGQWAYQMLDPASMTQSQVSASSDQPITPPLPGLKPTLGF